MFRRSIAIVALPFVACLAAGCASNARVAEDERRIVELQRHVVALEALLDDEDGSDDVSETKLVSTSTRPATRGHLSSR